MTADPHARTWQSMDRHAARCAHAHPRAAAERGIGIVEIIVVAVIIAIVLAIAMTSVGRSRANANVTKARTVARVLGESIEQFQRDHGGRLPVQPGLVADGRAQADWNATWTSPVDGGNRQGTTPKPYAAQMAVEPLVDRVAVLERMDGTVRSGTSQVPVRIRYYVNENRGLYALLVRSRTGNAWKHHCYVTNADAETTAGSQFLQPLTSLIGAKRPC